jgi:hypothetical protein
MNQRNALTVADNMRGADVMNREILKTIIESLPDGPGVLRHALSNAQQLRDRLVGTTQPESTLAGLDAAVGYWNAQLKVLEERRTGG